MGEINLKIFFDKKVQNLIKIIYKKGLNEFKMTSIDFKDDTYYLKKVTDWDILFCKLEYIYLTEKAYIRPISLIVENKTALIYPTLFEYYNDQIHLSELEISRHSDAEGLLISISSLEIINSIQLNKQSLLNGETVTAVIDGIRFLISDLYHSSINFHSIDGKIHIASYHYKLDEYSNEMTLEKFSFTKDFIENGEKLKEFKLIANFNEIDLD